MHTPVNLKILTNLRHGRVRWGNSHAQWSEFRAMVPLALMGGFSMDAHVAELGGDPTHGATAIEGSYKSGIQDWLSIRNAQECAVDTNEWPLFLLEYKAALSIDPTPFEKNHPALVVFNAMQDYCLWKKNVFGCHLPQRLQLALLHIEYLPPHSSAFDDELAIWHGASPLLRIEASPDIGTYYNLMQDPEILQWHLKNIHKTDTTSCALPESFELDA